jgi:hypothetical protein
MIMPAAALRTSGFPIAEPFVLPADIHNRPAPPPQTPDQPFAYRFRGTIERQPAVAWDVEYDPDLQVALVDGKLPDITMSNPTIQPTIAGYELTIEENCNVIADPIPDRARD